MDSYHTPKSGAFQPPISVPTTAAHPSSFSVIYYTDALAWRSVKGNTYTGFVKSSERKHGEPNLGNSTLDTTTRAKAGHGTGKVGLADRYVDGYAYQQASEDEVAANARTSMIWRPPIYICTDLFVQTELITAKSANDPPLLVSHLSG